METKGFFSIWNYLYVLVFYDSFEYLCYGSASIRCFVILSVWGSSLDLRIWRQILGSEKDPRAERVKAVTLILLSIYIIIDFYNMYMFLSQPYFNYNYVPGERVRGLWACHDHDYIYGTLNLEDHNIVRRLTLSLRGCFLYFSSIWSCNRGRDIQFQVEKTYFCEKN